MTKPRSPRFSRLADRSPNLAWDDRGAALAVVAMLGTALLLIAAVIVARQMTEFEVGASDQGWEEALHVAESGVDEMLYELDQNPSYMEDEDLLVTGALDTRDEIVAAAEMLVNRKAAALIDAPDGQVVVFEERDAEGTLYSVAFSPSIDAEHRLVRVLETEYEVTYNATHTFPPGALVSEGNVRFTGNGKTITVPTPPHEASVYSNRNVIGSGNAGIDGDAQAVGTVTGVGVAGDTTAGTDPVEFPEVEVVDMWRANLLADAQTGPTLGSVTSSRIINAPAYIAGAISLSGSETVVINGPGTVFIAGGINLSGQSRVINNGAMIATDGVIDQSGGSAYEVQGDPGAAGLVTFSSRPDAIKMSGGSSGSAQGIVYAPLGGVTLTGGAWFEGAVISGGAQGVEMTGSASIRYPAGLLDNASALPPAADGVELEDKYEVTGLRTTES